MIVSLSAGRTIFRGHGNVYWGSLGHSACATAVATVSQIIVARVGEPIDP
jgi:hypothetical protein